MSRHFITTPSDFRGVYAQLCEVFHAGNRLPEQVFRSKPERCAFVEFDLTMGGGFGELLSSFAARCGDSEVYVTALDPEPEEYYFSHFRRYGALRFKVEELEADYLAALRAEPEGSPADALLYVAEVVAWFGDTKSWAIWGERNLGVGVVADRSLRIEGMEPGQSTHGVKWFNVEDAISDLVALNFRGQVTPIDLATKFSANYGACR